MKKLTASLAALLLAACTTETEAPEQKFRDAMPKAQTAALETYKTEGGTTAAAGVSRDALGDSNPEIAQSEYAVLSYYLALSVNGGAGFILNLVQYIASFPADCDDAGTACTWGPWIGDEGLNAYKLVATKDGDAYHYALQGKPWASPDSAFVGILTGTAYPVDRDHGSGTFTLDFELAHSGLAHVSPPYEQKDFGQLVVRYDNTQSPVWVEADFIGARNQDPDPLKQHFMNAAYRFEDRTSGGRLQVAFENLNTSETLALNSRWSASGQGRADVLFTAAGGQSFTASECWAGRSANFAEVYDTKHLDDPRLQDASACAPFSTFEDTTIDLPVVP